MAAAATYFAPAGRATPDELAQLVDLVGESPLVGLLLQSVGGSLLVLDEHRQILAANRGVLDLLGIETGDLVVGLRPGEAFRCVSSQTGPDGCGTARRCSTCGAVIAVLAAREEGQPATRECLLTANTDEGEVAYEFSVRASPLRVDGRELTAVVLQDVSAEKRRQALERVFFHDLMNVVGGISGWSQVIEMLQGSQLREAAHRIVALSERLTQEVQQQRTLVQAERGELAVSEQDVAVSTILEALRLVFSGHPAAEERTLKVVSADDKELALRTDPILLERVLVNMVKNALEATPAGGTVVVEFHAEERPSFQVWNPGCMAAEVALQVFQRSFTTRGEPGRGLGTYSMKLFGERYLKGDVGFSSTVAGGTTFWIQLPADAAATSA